MDKTTAQTITRNVNDQLFALDPSSLVTLFEIDVGDIAFEKGMITQSEISLDNNVFRLHNNIKLFNTSIFWQGMEYIAMPIEARGFELNSRGTLPKPTITLSVNEQGVLAMALLKTKIKYLDNLIGAQVTRIRTFVKFLDEVNFPANQTPDYLDPAQGELPRDIYYIDRKSHEDKYVIEFELSSIFDLEGIKVPSRLVTSKTCVWNYRGEGCMYEYSNRRNETIHGDASIPLPAIAPPLATGRDEYLTDILGVSIVDQGQWQPNVMYKKGHAVYIEKNGLKYYFVAKEDSPALPPPNIEYWLADQCSKSLAGCRIRFGASSLSVLPFGAFPSINRLQNA